VGEDSWGLKKHVVGVVPIPVRLQREGGRWDNFCPLYNTAIADRIILFGLRRLGRPKAQDIRWGFPSPISKGRGFDAVFANLL